MHKGSRMRAGATPLGKMLQRRQYLNWVLEDVRPRRTKLEKGSIWEIQKGMRTMHLSIFWTVLCTHADTCKSSEKAGMDGRGIPEQQKKACLFQLNWEKERKKERRAGF